MSHTPPAADHAPVDNDDWKRYLVESQREILSLLKTIQHQNLLVNLEFAGGEGVISTILSIDTTGNTVVFDAAQNVAINQRLTSGGKVNFSTSLNGVKISFSASKVVQTTFEHRPALKILLPKEMIRLQRRDFFRVMMPIAHPVYCIIPPSPGLNEEQIKANIIDLSCGGVAISENEGKFCIQIGDVMPDCKLLLHDVGPMIVTLEVCNIAQITLHNGMKKTRLGCRFLDIPANMPTVLQRYIMNMERERLGR